MKMCSRVILLITRKIRWFFSNHYTSAARINVEILKLCMRGLHSHSQWWLNKNHSSILWFSSPFWISVSISTINQRYTILFMNY